MSEKKVAVTGTLETTPEDNGLQELIAALQERTEKAKPTGGQALQRAELAKLMLPSCFTKGADGKYELDKKTVKDWAYSTAQSIGLLAGLTIQTERLPGAIDEICREAKRVGVELDLASRSLAQLKEKPTSAASAAASAEEAAKKAKNSERQRHIQDLEDQAEGESNEAVKNALLNMAARLKKEIELEDAEHKVA